MPESPRPPQDDHGSWTRRQFLAAGGVVATGALAGCSGLPGTGPRTLDTVVHENSEDELSWDFPGQSDAESIGYVEIRRKPQFDSEGSIPSLWFTFNASIDPSSSYKLDQFTATFATPNTYFDQHGQLTYLVSPPTRSDSFNTYYQRAWGRTTHRQFVMDMDDIGLDGTIQFPFVIRDPQALPSTLQCSFSVQATESGTFGETVTASDSGTFEFD
ncbi:MULTISPECIES: twin-arginine translocation signal domain-containing protein [unclassified Haloferax]|uniref:twin-arginine translocation signal domain-containing protein n=1 Tax=unclassified Haloferax TaxID=2625095 RepID=UPI001F2F3462|nr:MULTISPECIES: twin-arginine translocation signal domain-containing protein [unclassified Haloferax]